MIHEDRDESIGTGSCPGPLSPSGIFPVVIDAEIGFSPVKFCTESWFWILKDEDFTVTAFGFPSGDYSFDGIITEGMTGLIEMLP